MSLPREQEVWDALQTVGDPEYPLSIVDLGMIYGVRVTHDVVEVTLTFTSIGCPAMDMIVADIQDAVQHVPGVVRTHIDIVWSPPWTKERISDRGRRVLAAHGVVS